MQTFLDTLRYFYRFAVLGLAMAFVLVLLRPEWLPALRGLENASPIPTETSQVNNPLPVVSYADAVNKAAPAVVSIYTNTLVPASLPGINNPIYQNHLRSRLPARSRGGLGSGLIVHPDGYILTSNHVIEQVDDIYVALADGNVYQPTVIGIDVDTDLAVLKIEADHLPVASLAENNDLVVGDVVLAIGNAHGLKNTVTMGIVSGKGRSSLDITTLEDFIQTDAAINAGNSGGALVNAHGDVVGINSSVLDQNSGAQGIGFAVPIAIAGNVMQQIIEFGSVRRGWLGANFSDVTWRPNSNNNVQQPLNGARIERLFPSGPAARAGLQPGDIILRWANIDIDNSAQLNLLIADTKPFSNVETLIERSAQQFLTSVHVIQQPQESTRWNLSQNISSKTLGLAPLITSGKR